MRPISVAVLLALSASLPAEAMDYYAGVGMRQAPSADEYPYLVGVQIEEDNDVYARAFGGVWLNKNFAIEGAYHDFGSSRLAATPTSASISNPKAGRSACSTNTVTRRGRRTPRSAGLPPTSTARSTPWPGRSHSVIPITV